MPRIIGKTNLYQCHKNVIDFIRKKPWRTKGAIVERRTNCQAKNVERTSHNHKRQRSVHREMRELSEPAIKLVATDRIIIHTSSTL